MEKADAVRKLVTKHFWEMADDASLNTGNKSVLPEDAQEFLVDYAEVLGVDMSGFRFNRYFPNEGIRFLPNVLLPKYMRTEKNTPAPLTVEMLILSAQSGRWLFG